MNRNDLGRVVTFAAIAGGAAAMLYLAVTAGGFGAVVLGYLAPLPLFVVGLWAGATAAALAGVLGAMLTAALTGSDVAPLTFLATAALPAALVAATALRDGPDGEVVRGNPGDALTALAGAAALGFFLAVIFASGEEGGLKAVLAGVLGSVLAQLAELGGAAGPESSEALWLAPALPGIVAASWMLMTTVNALLAQTLLTRFGRNRGPAMRFADLALPRALPAVFGAATAAGLLLPDPLGFWAVNLALIFAVPLFFAGLATAHAFAESRSARTPLLVAFYVFLFIFGWPIALMVGLGVIETWTGLSRRLRARPPGREN